MKPTKLAVTLQHALEHTPTFIVNMAGCPWCQRAVKTLNNNGIKYKMYDHEEDSGLAEEIKAKYNHKTFPMIFIDSEFVGGFTQLDEKLKKGGKKDRKSSKEDGDASL